MILLRFAGWEGERKKNPAAKTISCCFHYLMHHLQSGKWTRTQMTARGAQPYLATCRIVRKQMTKMGGGGPTRACSLCSCVVLRVTPKTSSLHTAPWDPSPCIASSASPPPLWLPQPPIPLLATRLLLTLVCPNKPFTLQQFGAPKGKKNIYYGSLPNWRPHTDNCCIYLGADQRYVVRRAKEKQTGTFESN